MRLYRLYARVNPLGYAGVLFFLTASIGPLLFAGTLLAATYFVDFQNGNNSSDGLTSSTAWKHSPGDSHYTGTVGLAFGDIVLFRRGSTYSGQITTQSDGVSYGVDLPWGTGDAIIDCSGEDACFAVHHSNVTIDGGVGKNLLLTGKSVNHAAVWCYGNDLAGNKFTRLTIRDVGSAASEEGIGIKIGGDSNAYTNMEISDNNISSCYSAAIKISGNGTRGNIFGNDIQGSGQLVGERCQVNISSSYSNGIEIHFYNNTIHDSGSTMVNGININGAGSHIYGNSIIRNSGAGVAIDPLYCPNHSGTTDVYNNNIRENSPEGTDEGIRIGSGSPNLFVRVWNNIIVNNSTNNYQVRTLDGTGYTKIWNNTIYTSNGTGGIWHYGTSSNTDIENNIISVNGYYAIRASNSSLTEDYNLLDVSRGGAEIAGITKGLHDFSGNPKLSNPSVSDFSIAPDSPARDRGNSLSAVFSTDYAGVNRPQGSAWDIGAYEYVGGTTRDTTPPAAPTGVRMK